MLTDKQRYEVIQFMLATLAVIATTGLTYVSLLS